MKKITKMYRRCVVCGKDWGPSWKSCCTENSLIGMWETGFFKKKREYFSLDGHRLSQTDIEKLSAREKKVFQAKKNSSVQKNSSVHIDEQRKCTICVKKLTEEDVTNAKKKDEAAQDPFYRKHRIGMSSELGAVWDLGATTYYCHQCYSNPESWDKNKKRCINCISFSANYTRQPGLPNFYCHRKEHKAISNPQDNVCENWVREADCFF